ncbi:MAG: Na+/H+ antiporter subunit G [Gemmatimonadaceae bacterium]|nr:Na+/H+ antiporter subunit G [Gemmatimonadaceae bacterium]
MALRPFVDWVIAALLVVGAAFALVGSIGLVRLPDFLSRLHGPTKATTLGVGATLAASMLWFSTRGTGVSLHELLVAGFLFLTAPASAHLLAKAARHVERRDGGAPPPHDGATVHEAKPTTAPGSRRPLDGTSR